MTESTNNTEAILAALDDSDKAFVASFKDTHGQYDITDEAIAAFMHGDVGYFNSVFDGYTQLADAYNLWGDALNFARRAK